MTANAARDVHSTAIDTIRFLAVDMVEQAKSGHPGAPMGQATLAYALWTRHLRCDPATPGWPNRDRFVLSCGHASALLYSLLHLAGYDLPIEELRRFRQLGSKTPGHPEHGLTPGVETTTGPLGQGLSNAVGMAMAERVLAEQLNRPGFPLIDHRIWVLASDGDMMEGVASEASSLAGHLRLGKLVVVYDANRISIDGSTDLAFTENVRQRYEAYGWRTLEVDGHDLDAVDAALAAAASESARPTLVLARTHIGFGSPKKQDTADVHGSPLGGDEVLASKQALGWPTEPTFLIPDEARAAFAGCRERGRELRERWDALFERYAAEHPRLAEDFRDRLEKRLPAGWDADLPRFAPGDGAVATRSASGKVLAAVAPKLPRLLGGSADLAPSNNTYLKGEAVFAPDRGGRNLHFGVREHAMAATLSGMALSGLLRPYGGTFLIFSDYMRPSIRLAAMMGLPTIYVLTHDSIFLGEDGPTHQPVSQLLSMRAIPGLTVFRPADANETVEAWRAALEHHDGPTALILTRQGLPVLAPIAERAREGVARGGYVVADPPDGEPRAILIASGSEVALIHDAHLELLAAGIPTRVVSLPCWSRFDAQDRGYRDAVLPPSIRTRLAVEAGVAIGWHAYVGADGDVLGIDGFGASAPYQHLAEPYGFTVANVVARLRSLL